MRVLVITGSGVSAESGIPTFRGPGGYWRNLDPVSLATPEAFARNPRLVWDWYNERRQRIRAAQPNPAHAALVRLAENAAEFLLVTQNVDDLHARAGLIPSQIVQIHGDIFLTRCSECDYTEETDSLTAAGTETSRDIPCCQHCGAFMRPGVVWFGEQLDPAKVERVEDYLARGRLDLTLVIGTTALFGYIVDWAMRPTAQLIEINPEESPMSAMAGQTVRQPAGIVLPGMVDSLLAQRSAPVL